MNHPTEDDTVSVAFVCVQNAGRSQMATAFAERELENRSIHIDIRTGGTDPADHVHPEVVEVMSEEDMDLSDRVPKHITAEELVGTDYIITMGCSAEGVCPAGWTGENRDWDLDDPDGEDLDAVRSTRNEIKNRVRALFDEIEGHGDTGSVGHST